MTDFRPLDPTLHADQGYAPVPDYLHSRAEDRVPLLIAEVPTALMVYPMAFAQMEGRLRLVAVLGCRAGQNNCLGDAGRWLTGYVPSHLRAWPFALIPNGNGNDGLTLGFDLDSGLWRTDPDAARGEKRFYDIDGQLSSALQRFEKFLYQRAANLAITDTAAAELHKAGVLVPWQFPEAMSGGMPPEGLLRVDQKALHTLTPDMLAHLMAANALALAHAQIFSVPRLGILAQLKENEAGRGDMAKVSGFFAGDEGDLNFSLDE